MTTDRRGMSLLETVIAIFIIVVALVGALALIISTISAGRSTTNRLIAINLAREGIEAVRWRRDTNWLSQQVASDCDGVLPPIVPCEWDDKLSEPLPPVNDDSFDGIVFYSFDASFPPYKYPGTGITIPHGIWLIDYSINDINEPKARLYRMSDGTFIQFGSVVPQAGDLNDSTAFSRLITTNPICRENTATDDAPNVIGPVGNAPCGLNYSKIGIRVTSEVQWQDRGQTLSVALEDHLYNWQ